MKDYFKLVIELYGSQADFEIEGGGVVCDEAGTLRVSDSMGQFVALFASGRWLSVKKVLNADK